MKPLLLTGITDLRLAAFYAKLGPFKRKQESQSMSTLYAGGGAIAFYISALVYQALQLRQPDNLKRQPLLWLVACAIALHGLAGWQLVVSTSGFDFSLWRSSAAILFMVNVIVLLSSMRKPAHNLFLFLSPFSVLVLAIALQAGSSSEPRATLAFGVGIHVLISILSYSLLTIAALQALLLAFQNWQLRHKHLKGWINALPPLETMEELLFEVLWAGVALLTASLLSGLWLFEDMFAQHLVHKTVFSLAAWLIYAVLLWGRHQLGWRGNKAIRWTLGGFAAMVLAYWGSKFVLEILLS